MMLDALVSENAIDLVPADVAFVKDLITGEPRHTVGRCVFFGWRCPMLIWGSFPPAFSSASLVWCSDFGLSGVFVWFILILFFSVVSCGYSRSDLLFSVGSCCLSFSFLVPRSCSCSCPCSCYDSRSCCILIVSLFVCAFVVLLAFLSLSLSFSVFCLLLGPYSCPFLVPVLVLSASFFASLLAIPHSHPIFYHSDPPEKGFLFEIVANKRNGIDVDT